MYCVYDRAIEYVLDVNVSLCVFSVSSCIYTLTLVFEYIRLIHSLRSTITVHDYSIPRSLRTIRTTYTEIILSVCA